MAKKSMVESNRNRKKLIDSKKETRQKLKAEIKDQSVTFEERINLVHKLSKLPRNSSAVRYRNRCLISGRPRGYYRKFAMSRIALRELISAGMIPGVTKASW